jgi:hypothetical protein
MFFGVLHWCSGPIRCRPNGRSRPVTYASGEVTDYERPVKSFANEAVAEAGGNRMQEAPAAGDQPGEADPEKPETYDHLASPECPCFASLS